MISKYSIYNISQDLQHKIEGWVTILPRSRACDVYM